MPDQDHLAQRQAQLNKALSTALLNHQISELESQVKHLPTPVQDALQHDSQLQRAPGVSAPVAAIAAKEKGKPLARIDDHMSFGEDGARRLDDDERERDEDIEVNEDLEPEWRVAVVDVSAFMWAPQAARDLVQKGFEVIVPANGIVTLDLLKKGDSPSAQAARKAARYIEHASRQYKVLSNDPSITVQIGTNYKRGSGLRFQREDETRQIDEMSSLPLMPGEEGPPNWVQSVLGCAAYFVGINKAELDNTYDRDERELPPALYIASPSFAIQIAQDPTDTRPLTRENREEAERNGSKNERGEGVILQEEAERFELGIAILRDNDDVQPQFSTRGARDRDRDRGNQRNGNGPRGGVGERNRMGMVQRPRKKEEEVPEIKVLLRRPQAHGETIPFSDKSDSPASLILGLPDISIPPPLGLSAKTMANSRSSNEISPPTNAKHLPVDTKLPVSKFVPLTRETHPVRRYADSASSTDEPSQRERGAKGGRGGRTATGAGRGNVRSKNRDRDPEFKNGNFVLLKRPDPPAPIPATKGRNAPTSADQPSKPSDPNSSSVPAPTPAKQMTILARKPAPPPKPVQAPAATATVEQSPKAAQTPAAAPPTRTILQRPPRAPVPTPTPAPAAPTTRAPIAPNAPRAFAPDIRGRGRGRGVSRGPASQSFASNRPRPPVPAAIPSAPAVPSVPKAMNAEAATFEFDDAMLRPGYGSAGYQEQNTVERDGFAMNARGRGQAHGHAHGQGHSHGFGPGFGMPRGRGGFRPHPHPPHHHHHHHHHHHPPPHHYPPFAQEQAVVPQSQLQAQSPGPPQSAMPMHWQPAEPAKKVIMQRPTS